MSYTPRPYTNPEVTALVVVRNTVLTSSLAEYGAHNLNTELRMDSKRHLAIQAGIALISAFFLSELDGWGSSLRCLRFLQWLLLTAYMSTAVWGWLVKEYRFAHIDPLALPC